MIVPQPYLLPALALPVFCAFLFAMQYDPLRLSGRFVSGFARGAVLLGAWNLLFPLQHIAFNVIGIALSGWLGLPGAVLVAFLPLL